MATLIFLATILTLLIIFIRAIVKLIQHKSVTSTLRTIIIVAGSYSIVWSIFYFSNGYKTIPFGRAICFDDWCATVTKVDSPASLGNQHQLIMPHGKFIVLHIKMINEAKGIAQKPSKSRVHLIDEKGNSYSFSYQGQQALANQIGEQFPIDGKLELHQWLETQVVFDVPNDANNLKALIEEGPFITKLLFNESKDVFNIPNKQ